MIEVINYLLTRTDGVAVAIGDVMAVDDETALIEARTCAQGARGTNYPKTM
jgi:hypothetical protein